MLVSSIPESIVDFSRQCSVVLLKLLYLLFYFESCCYGEAGEFLGL